jgi:excisionase family DNA binding protein
MKTYGLREAALLLGVKVRTVRQWIRLGKIEAVKGANGWYWEIPETEIRKRLGNEDKD